MLRAAVIGLGKMGISHAAIVGAHPKVELRAVADTSSLVLDGFKKYSRANVYSDYRKLLDVEELDFVVIATPSKFHYAMTRYAFDKGLHVFCEKPFILDLSEGEELVAMSREKVLVNQVGYHNHFIGTFRKMKGLLKAGVLGPLVHFKGEASGPVVTREKGGTWRSQRDQGGGCLFDYASHVINLIQEIIARPSHVEGSIMKRIYSKSVDDAVYCLLYLENRVSGILEVNWSDETYRKMSTSITVQGKKGKIICDATELKIYLQNPNHDHGLESGWTTSYITDLASPVNYYLRGEEYSAQIDYFIDQVMGDRNVAINSFAEAQYTDQVIHMILENQQKYG